MILYLVILQTKKTTFDLNKSCYVSNSFFASRSEGNYISPVAYLCLCTLEVNTGTSHYSE